MEVKVYKRSKHSNTGAEEPKATLQERLASLTALKALMQVDLQVKEICNDWILLTYDLPSDEQGMKARVDFLKKARSLGAVQHTESVYLLPWTADAELAALDVAKAGNAFLWISNVKDNELAGKLTDQYDEKLFSRLKELSDRVEKVKQYIQNGELGIANRMMKKTQRLISELQSAISRRGSATLMKELDRIIAILES